MKLKRTNQSTLAEIASFEISTFTFSATRTTKQLSLTPVMVPYIPPTVLTFSPLSSAWIIFHAFSVFVFAGESAKSKRQRR